MEGNRIRLASDFHITRDGTPAASIVVRTGAPDKVMEAARDLQDIIRRMSGAELPICDDAFRVEGNKILLGPSGYTRIHNVVFPEQKGEWCLLRRREDTLVLAGNDEGCYTGTQFAVTMLLERLGCGWFGPEELWQVIPQKKTLTVGYLDILHTPQFSCRRTRVLEKNPEIGRRWYQGGDKSLIEHAYSILFPREQYFEAHPDWYCMHGGVRDPYNNRSIHLESWQMCYSNPELAQATADKVIAFFDAHPDYASYSLAANDGMYEGFCECEECQKWGMPGEVMMEFVNRVARLTAAKYPDKTLYFFVYFPTFDPPNRFIQAEPNVQLMFCKESCMYHPVDKGPDCGYHEDYEFEFRYTQYPRPWRQTMEKWLEMTGLSSFCIWEWYCPAACVTSWEHLPWVQGDVATRNQRFWHDKGATFVFYDQGPNDYYHDTEKSYPLRWPLWYVVSKGMWDKDLTGTDILTDACKKLFEQAADVMLSYYLALADISRDCHAKNIAWQSAEPYEFYTPAAIERVDRILARAAQLLDEVSGPVRARMENQMALWEACKRQVEASYSGSAYQPIY